MKHGVLLLLIPSMAGCAYLHDRGRDACDMVTVAVEAPCMVNATVQLGPFMTGLGIAGGSGFGLRSGGMGVYDTEEMNLLYGGLKEFVPRGVDQQRGKGYDFDYVAIPHTGSASNGWFNWFQIEAALGIVVGVRAGFNPAEMLDFVLGWTTVDICHDDLETDIHRDRSSPATRALPPPETGAARARTVP